MKQKHLVWAALCVPLCLLVADKLLFGTPGARFFYWTGVLSMTFITVSLLATPMNRVLKGRYGSMWLLRQRRYTGLAGFGYMAAHTAYWLMIVGVSGAIESSVELVVILGWIGLVILTAMAITSNDYSVRKMGPGWHSLQRWIYIGAPISMWHWAVAVNYDVGTLLLNGLPLLAILSIRILVRRHRVKKA